LPILRILSSPRLPAFRATNRRGGTDAAAEKKPRHGELTKAEKRANQKISRLRVRVEHALAGVKRARGVKEVLRNTKETIADLFMLIACGLYNLRVRYRKRRLQL
jgi:hypothetical protein